MLLSVASRVSASNWVEHAAKTDRHIVKHNTNTIRLPISDFLFIAYLLVDFVSFATCIQTYYNFLLML